MRKNNLSVVYGGQSPEGKGPIERLKIRETLPFYNRNEWAVVLVVKTILLGSMLYFFLA